MTCPRCSESTMLPVSVEQLAFDGNTDFYQVYVCPRCWYGKRT